MCLMTWATWHYIIKFGKKSMEKIQQIKYVLPKNISFMHCKIIYWARLIINIEFVRIHSYSINSNFLSRWSLLSCTSKITTTWSKNYSLHSKLLETFNKSLCPKLDDLFLIYQNLDIFLEFNHMDGKKYYRLA
jgi:hypothetical protein